MTVKVNNTVFFLALRGSFLAGQFSSDYFGKDVASSPSVASAAHVTARAGTNITLACPGVSPTSLIYLVEWKCLGCDCSGCPNPSGDGARLLRYNNKLTRWGDEDSDRRGLEFERYGLRFEPVRAGDSGTYLCLLNNRREPDSPIVLTVQGERRA